MLTAGKVGVALFSITTGELQIVDVHVCYRFFFLSSGSHTQHNTTHTGIYFRCELSKPCKTSMEKYNVLHTCHMSNIHNHKQHLAHLFAILIVSILLCIERT